MLQAMASVFKKQCVLQSKHPSSVSNQVIFKIGGSAENCAGCLFFSESGHFPSSTSEQTESVVAQPLQEPCAVVALLWLHFLQGLLDVSETSAIYGSRQLEQLVFQAVEKVCDLCG